MKERTPEAYLKFSEKHKLRNLVLYHCDIAKIDRDSILAFERDLQRYAPCGSITLAIDFQNVDYIYPAVLQVLVRKQREFKERGCEIILIDTTPEVDKIIDCQPFKNFFRKFKSESQSVEV